MGSGEAVEGREVLVCGGAGYIASFAIRALLARGARVVVVDNLSTGHRASLPADVTLVRADVGDRPAIARVLAAHDVQAVMHFCANAYVGESVQNPSKYYNNNLSAGLALLDVLIDHGVRNIVFSSSCTVYGHPPRIPLDESCPLQPISPYGRTKAFFEHILADYQRAYGLRWVALRYFNAAGAMPDGSLGEDHDPETHLVPLVLRQALVDGGALAPAAGPLQVFGGDYDTPDGTCVRDYIHVLDLADAHVRALDYLAAGQPPMAMNLANKAGFSVLEVIESCRRITGCQIPYDLAPRRPGDPAALVGDPAVAMGALGWRPVHSDLDTIVASAWRWHLSHPRGYQDGAERVDGDAVSPAGSRPQTL